MSFSVQTSILLDPAHKHLKCISFYAFFFFFFTGQKLPHPTGRSLSLEWRKIWLIERKKAAKTSGSKLAPETRLPSPAKLTLSAHPSLTSLVGTSGTLTSGFALEKYSFMWRKGNDLCIEEKTAIIGWVCDFKVKIIIKMITASSPSHLFWLLTFSEV